MTRLVPISWTSEEFPTILPVLRTLQCLKTRVTNLAEDLARDGGHYSECQLEMDVDE